MPRFAANLTMMYTEVPFLERFAAAARDGFQAVEYLFPYDYPAAQLAEHLKAHNLQQVLINAPAGDWNTGERGTACVPGRETDFRNAIHRALEYAEALGCPRVHAMAGVIPEHADRAALRATYVANLAWAAQEAANAGKDLLIEPINPTDMPGYFLNRQEEAHAVAAEIGLPNLKVQLDLYHCSLVEGDAEGEVRKRLGSSRKTAVGHMQVAGVPGRHEPDNGTLDFEPLFALIDSLGFNGWIGCEYRPKAATSEGLGWLRHQKKLQRD